MPFLRRSEDERQHAITQRDVQLRLQNHLRFIIMHTIREKSTRNVNSRDQWAQRRCVAQKQNRRTEAPSSLSLSHWFWFCDGRFGLLGQRCEMAAQVAVLLAEK